MSVLPNPPVGDPVAVARWVGEFLGHVSLEGPDGIRSGGLRGGQAAADAALAGLDITGYARSRSTVLPRSRRGASRLSPYIRYGLLALPQVWAAVGDAPAGDRRRFRDELLWQEYARHLYWRTGPASAHALRYQQPATVPPSAPAGARPDRENAWPVGMNCVSAVLDELHEDGWLVNQTRMWLASQWSVRDGNAWQQGEQEMFAHLLDGSRAANRLGWQWTVGTGSGKPYGFSRWQVTKRAPQLCRDCALASACPIENWPEVKAGSAIAGPDLGRRPTPAGPSEVEAAEPGATAPTVWLTAESLGVSDPALAADPERAAVFVFDEPLLRRLRLSGKRLVFLAETLGELAASRPLEVRLGRVEQELAGYRLAATWTPVPGWQRLRESVRPIEVHPWPWLIRPGPAAVRSFSAWRRDHGA